MLRLGAVDQELDQPQRLHAHVRDPSIPADPAVDRVATGHQGVLDLSPQPDLLAPRDPLAQRPREPRDHHVIGIDQVNHERRLLQIARCLDQHVEDDRCSLLDVRGGLPALVQEGGVDGTPIDLHGHRLIDRRSDGLAVSGHLVVEVQPVVAQRGILGLTDVLERPVVQDHGPVAQRLYGGHVVRHDHDGLPGAAPLVKDVHALLGERRVADRQHLVDQHDVGVRLDHDGEGEPGHHPGGVVLQLQVREPLELRELEDGVEALARLPPAEPEQDAVQNHVLSSGHLRVEADAELDERCHPSGHSHPARVGPVDAGENLQQRALARSVAADDAEELAFVHVERHVLERAQLAVGDPREGMGGAFLDRVDPVLGDLERLEQVPRLDHNRPGPSARSGRRSDRDRLRPACAGFARDCHVRSVTRAATVSPR